MLKIPHVLALTGGLMALLSPAVAQAYMGPGVGLGAVGVALGLVGSVLLGLISLIWYPVKRMIRRMRSAKSDRSLQ